MGTFFETHCIGLNAGFDYHYTSKLARRGNRSFAAMLIISFLVSRFQNYISPHRVRHNTYSLAACTGANPIQDTCNRVDIQSSRW